MSAATCGPTYPSTVRFTDAWLRLIWPSAATTGIVNDALASTFATLTTSRAATPKRMRRSPDSTIALRENSAMSARLRLLADALPSAKPSLPARSLLSSDCSHRH